VEALLIVFIAILCAIGLAAAVIYGAKAKEAWQTALRSVADQFGVAYDPGTWLRGSSVEGNVDGRHYKLDTFTVSTGKSSQTYTRIVLDTELPKGLELKKEGIFSGLAKTFVGDDVQVGIDRFDDEFLLKGRRDVAVLARLGLRSRKAMWTAVREHGVKLKNGQLAWVVGGMVSDLDRLLSVSESMFELAGALAEHSERPAVALLHHAFSDPDMRFRRRCLAALIDDMPRAPETADALQRAAGEDDPGLRFLAAAAQGAPGLPTIKTLLADERLPQEMRERGATLLGPQYGGGLSIATDEGQGGELSLQADADGGLSEAREAEPAKPRRGKQRQ
jgi:hypothetical protein